MQSRTSYLAKGDVLPVDPRAYPEWDSLLLEHSGSSFFHTTSWARVLHDTYGHRPFYLTKVNGSKIHALLPVMEVSSWCTRRRGVSLPFTDLCPPLTSRTPEPDLYEAALELGHQRGWQSLQCRYHTGDWPGAKPSLSFYSHSIDLQHDSETLLKRTAGSLRRGIRKAEEEGLQISFDTEPDSLSLYYSLHCRTRRKHGVPPQPFRFFANIGRHVLRPGLGFVASARWQGRPVAAAVFFKHGSRVIYKFGASDYRFQHLRPNNLLMWKAIEHCASSGCESLHLGRTSMSNEGLRRFKLSLGADEHTISYAKYDLNHHSFVRESDRAEGPINRIFRCLPSPLFRLAGQMIYPHLS